MISSGGKRRARSVTAFLAACLVLAACGTRGAERSTPGDSRSAPGVSASSAPGSATPPGVGQVESALVEQAEKKGQGPDGAGVSRVMRPEATAFLWEASGERLCLGEAVLDGGLTSFLCVRSRTAGPPDSPLPALLFGPGMLGEGGRVVLAGPPGWKIASVTYRGVKAETAFVRSLSSGWAGRALYYVVLPEFPKEPLDVTLRSGGKERVERLPMTG